MVKELTAVGEAKIPISPTKSPPRIPSKAAVPSRTAGVTKSLTAVTAASGLTKTEFCARNGIDRRQFFHWQKQIREYVLAQNPELGLPPHHGQMQQIRAVNSQIIPSLPVFCELKPREDPLSVQNSTASAFTAEAMIRLGQYQIYVDGSVSERKLATILSVIRHA